MLERVFEPSFLRRLDHLTLGIRRARTVRLGRRMLGRMRGSGIEIENFKDYAEGDDLRFLDWNALARLDSLLLKSFRVERETQVSILVDASASMGVPVADRKFELACLLACALAYVALGQNDPVRLTSFAAPQGKPLFAGSDFLHRVESYAGLRPIVTQFKTSGDATLEEAAVHLLAQHRTPGVVIVLSDFLYEAQRYRRAFDRLLNARYEVKAIQVLGQREAEVQLTPGAYRLRDCESGQVREFNLSPEALEACRQKLRDLRRELQDFCLQRGIIYAHVIGAENYESFLTTELPRLGLVE
jgi:uncharacterized protein (DUF58 family)